MTFLKNFRRRALVVFSRTATRAAARTLSKTMCECYSQLGEMAGEMGLPSAGPAAQRHGGRLQN